MLDERYLKETLNFFYFQGRLNTKTFLEYLLDHYKRERKSQNVSGAAAKNMFLDVYEKRGITASYILEQLLERSWIELDDAGYFKFTEIGVVELKKYYSNDYCSEYASFEAKVHELTVKHKEPDFKELFIMSMYWRGWTLDYIEKNYFTNPMGSRDVLHKQYQDENGIVVAEDDFVLHIQPMIFLDWEDTEEPIELTIEGLDDIPEFKLLKPFRNKRYVVAMLASNKNKALNSFGWYAIQAKTTLFPTYQDLKFIWKIGEFKEITHRISIEFVPGRGNLYSTTQYMMRESVVETFKICSASSYEAATVLKDSYKNSVDMEFDTFDLGNKSKFIISEFKTLTSIPMHLHNIT